MEIVPSDNPYEAVIPLLRNSGADFINSDEYRVLIGNADDLPGVVAAAYSNYIARLVKSDQNVGVEKLVRPLNIMADWGDVLVNQMLRDEVIDKLLDNRVVDRIRPYFNDNLLLLVSEAPE